MIQLKGMVLKVLLLFAENLLTAPDVIPPSGVRGLFPSTIIYKGVGY